MLETPSSSQSSDSLSSGELQSLPFSFPQHKRASSFSSNALSPVSVRSGCGVPLELSHGVCSIQGKRKTQEDAHSSVPQLARRPSEKSKFRNLPFAFYGIYDGHGGEKASEYVCANLHERFAEFVQEKKTETDIKHVEKSLRRAILKVEEDWMRMVEKHGKDCSGTTVAVIVIKDNHMVVANVGDSEIVMCGPGNNAITLSEVHNPSRNKAEIERVTSAGGVIFRERVGHPLINPAIMSIAVSRAVGDYGFKAKEFTKGKPSGLIPEPYTHSLSLQPHTDHFVIIACDGVW
eukprot:CAMPEP_0174252490 /NCGR_PEP_ID=MMETSP0439-20130205/1938_1 /TAXON_ID=0 /ORGANISM="Stereomyxa ramosa, Strain Chinc5" /LENGTH=290 /DNA_ID=CAMNT_0015333035 /DNA_START=12 /DNA_END=881 /DNA_ORIENTATION=+